MRITNLTIKNWRNFKSVDLALQSRLFIVGANASGKSNLLDALRFLRDLSSVGGGFQQAIDDRGGLARVRCLAARNFNHGHVEIKVALGDDDQPRLWTYTLALSSEQRGKHRPVIVREIVTHQKHGIVLNRPDAEDRSDSERLTQTALEQVNANRDFREVAEFLAGIRYIHLVPQILRDPRRSIDEADDPFGGDFLRRIAKTPSKTRDRHLARINQALQVAVPQLEQLELRVDGANQPHLEARYRHWREHGARQTEQDFSDGTLRLIGLLWALVESKRTSSVLLLEEPELSLHWAVVRQLPSILSRVQGTRGLQILLTTHAGEMVGDDGLGLDEVALLSPTPDGTVATLATDITDVSVLRESGLNLDEIIRPLTEPRGVEQLSLLVE